MSIAIVIPTYNEADNIERLIEELLVVVDGTLVIVDDSSPDGTAEMVSGHPSGRVHLIHREKKSGIGSAYREGFDWALKNGFQMIAQMDADFSHRPADLAHLISACAENTLVLGSRYIKGGKVTGWGPWRHFCSRSAMAAARFSLGLKAKDVTSGFRVWNAGLLARVLGEQSSSNGYAFQEEMLFHAQRLGGRIVEVPITFVDRVLGRSKLGWGDVTEFFTILSHLKKTYGRLS